MLLNWLMDEKPVDDRVTWAANYSILINFDCFQAIHKRAALLVSISSTLNDWHQSDYGRLLRITDPSTLAIVRQFWIKYSKFANPQPLSTISMRNSCNVSLI
jgi:hypothetical protein